MSLVEIVCDFCITYKCTFFGISFTMYFIVIGYSDLTISFTRDMV